MFKRWSSVDRVRVCLATVLTAIIVVPAAAEPVQRTFAPDAATVGLWRFEEGQGDSSVAVKGPAAILHGATWVPGMDAYALAMHSGYVAIPDDPALRPEKAMTVELWVKLQAVERRLGLQELRLHDAPGRQHQLADRR